MKVYSGIDGINVPNGIVYDAEGKIDWNAGRAAEEKYEQDIIAEVRKVEGGECHGEIYATPRGDGYARYVLCNPKRGTGYSSFLVHLATGDAWHDPDVQYVPKAEVIKRIKQRSKMAEIFRAR